jgi:hypothetical protein
MIRTLLLGRIAWTDDHQGVMAACVAACLIVAGVVERALS